MIGRRVVGIGKQSNVLLRFYSTKDIVPLKKAKKPLMERIKHEVKHYANGTKLLGYEIKTSTKLLMKYVQGYELSRRESNQLQRTTKDVLRLVPFSAFVVVPFAELLLPIALKLFPNLLPSTYESGTQKQQKRTKLMEIRRKTSSFLHQTLEESVLINYNNLNSNENKELFVKFFQRIYSKDYNRFTHDEIAAVARLFKNDTVLDNLSRPQLSAMIKFMSLRPFGSDNMLRYQIRSKLKNIINDDKIIDYEGVDSLSKEELYAACVSRGMKAYGVSETELKENLEVWLDMRLRAKIPSVLMVLSSTFTFGKEPESQTPNRSYLPEAEQNQQNEQHLDSGANYYKLLDIYYNGILHVLSTIPDPVYNVAKLDVSEVNSKPDTATTTAAAPAAEDASATSTSTSTPTDAATDTTTSTTRTDDNEFKLNVLKEQEAMIKQEQEETTKRRTNEKHDTTTLDDDEENTPPVPLNQTKPQSILKK